LILHTSATLRSIFLTAAAEKGNVTPYESLTTGGTLVQLRKLQHRVAVLELFCLLLSHGVLQTRHAATKGVRGRLGLGPNEAPGSHEGCRGFAFVPGIGKNLTSRLSGHVRIDGQYCEWAT
jgi:hypothetical protein